METKDSKKTINYPVVKIACDGRFDININGTILYHRNNLTNIWKIVNDFIELKENEYIIFDKCELYTTQYHNYMPSSYISNRHIIICVITNYSNMYWLDTKIYNYYLDGLVSIHSPIITLKNDMLLDDTIIEILNTIKFDLFKMKFPEFENGSQFYADYNNAIVKNCINNIYNNIISILKINYKKMNAQSMKLTTHTTQPLPLEKCIAD